MGVRIAVASTDGVTVNQHFGRAQQFRIYQLTADGPVFLEKRDNLPPCAGHEHNDDLLEWAAALIADCRGVVASQIGPGAIDVLLDRRIFAFTMTGRIEDALVALQKTTRFTYLK